MKIKAFLLIIIVILTLSLTVSCTKNREYDEAEVTLAAKELLKKSEKLNYIYYGYGIEYEMNESEANGAYYRADSLSLEKLGIRTVEDIEKLTYDTYTQSLSQSVILTKLNGRSLDEDSTVMNYARYYQKINALDGSNECIMVYKLAEVYLTDDTEYLYDTLRVIGSEGETVLIEVDVKVTNSEGKEQIQTLKFTLLEEINGWRINSPTYVKFVDREYYEDLQNKK
jgi:hypothetical protein